MASNGDHYFEEHVVDEEIETEIDEECTDSPFDDDSAEENNEDEDEDVYFPVIPAELADEDGDADGEEEIGARPYMFQPVLPEGQAERRAIVDPDEMWRLENLDWCTCGNCQLMSQVVECVCCRETPVIIEKMAETANPDVCIIEHEFFETVCICRAVLEVAYIGYKTRDQQIMNQDNLNNRFRYTAYRQFVRWNWGILGRRNRVPVPSCTIKRISESYPVPQGQERRGFMYPPAED